MIAHEICIHSIPFSSLVLVAVSSQLSSAIVIVLVNTCDYLPNALAFGSRMVLKETQHKCTRACVSLNISHMVAELCGSTTSAEMVEYLQKVGEQPSEFLVEEQNALVPQMAEQWLEVPKIIHQDRILQQTAKQIAGRLEAKRDLAGAEKSLTASGRVFSDEWKAQAECLRNVRGNRRAVGRVITGVKRKFHGEEQLKLIVDKCAAKVEGELQKKMATETGENQLEEVDDQIEWAVHEGGQLMASLRTRDQDIGARTGSGTSCDIKGSPRSPQARQVWLKMDGKIKVVDLGEETGKEMEEKVRRWMRVEKGTGLYVICEGRRLSWRDLAELGDGKTAEVMIELKGVMSKKKSKKNPWNTPSQSSSGSEPEIIRTETGGSSVEERDDEKLQEVLEKKVTEALEEGGVLDQLVEGLAVMKGEEREKMMQMYEAAVPRELRDKNIVAEKATIEKLVAERKFEKERKKKVSLIKEGIRRRYFQQGSGPGDILNFGMYEGWRFGDVYICHPTYGEWAVDQAKPKMWKLKCFKFFLKRLADLDRLLQQEESLEQVNITRVEMCESLTEEMAAEDQQAVEECMKVGKQRIRWADLEESQIEEVEMKSPERIQEKGSGTGAEKWVSYDTAVEEHEAVMQRQQKEEEMMAAGWLR